MSELQLSKSNNRKDEINGNHSPKSVLPIKRSKLVPSGSSTTNHISAALPRDLIETPLQTRAASPLILNPPIDSDGLSWPSQGARQRIEQSPEEAKAREERIADAVKVILEELGEDTTREGLLETPERYARAMLYFTKGYEDNIRDVIKRAVFEEDHDEMVIVRDIEIYSLCEHHLVPFLVKLILLIFQIKES